MKTLLSRRSILKDGLPAAASVCAIGILGFDPLDRERQKKDQYRGYRLHGFSHKERARRPSSTLDLLASLVVLGGTMEVNGGPLRNSVEHHMTVPDLTAPVVQRERMDSVHAAAFTKDIAVFFDLQ